MKINNRLYITTILNHIQRVYILIWKEITNYIYQQYSNNIKQYLKRNSFINLLLVGYFQTPCPLSSSSSPAQQHHKDATLCLLPQHHEDHDLQSLRLSDHDLLPSHHAPHQRRRFYTSTMVNLGLGKLFFNWGSF